MCGVRLNDAGAFSPAALFLAPSHRLSCFSPPLQAAIRKELNDYKSNEMEVHESSRHLTR